VTKPVASLEEALQAFAISQNAVRTYDAVHRVAREAVEDLAAENVRLAELRFSPDFLCEPGGLDRDDAWQRATELLFERLAVSWTIAGLEITRQKELLGRYRMASPDERRFVRESLRAHVAEQFPELEAP